MKLIAKELISYTEDQMWNLPPNTAVELQFDDGVMETTVERTIFSYYYWEVHKHYPMLPMLMSHHLGNDYFNNGLHAEVLRNISRDLYKYMDYTDYVTQREDIWLLLFNINNNIYNKMISNLDRYVVTSSFEDFVELIEYDKIKEVNSKVKPTQRSIDEAHGKIKKLVLNDENLADNNQTLLVKSGSVNMKQELQLLSARGFVTDVNSRILPVPITNSFTTGMNKLYESMFESRSASKALLLAKDPLSLCEYFNRKLQLMSQTIESLSYEDCGSDVTYPWLIEAGELVTLDGINYMEDGVMKTISKKDKSLIGKQLNLRLPFGCKHQGEQTICVGCLGEVGLSLPNGVNLGHMSAIDLGEKISQLVLSTKHHEGSSEVDEIIVADEFLPYVNPSSDGITIKFSEELQGKKAKIILDVVRGGVLASLKHVDLMEDVTYMGSMSDVTLEVVENGELERVKVPCSNGARKGSFTKAFLMYIKHRGVKLNEQGEYEIDISDWVDTKVDNGVFTLPLKHTNMIDFKDEVESFILTSKRTYGLMSYAIKGSPHKHECDVVEALKGLNTLVSSKISINMSHLSIIALAMSAVDPINGDYNICKGGVPVRFSRISSIMAGRSLSVAMAYEGQSNHLSSHNSYINKNRPRHPMDLILLK